MTGGSAERHLAARVLNALLREDYGGLAARVSHTKHGVRLVLPRGQVVRLAPGRLYQDFVVAPDEPLTLAQVLGTLAVIAAPGDADGVAAFGEECHAALRAHDWHQARRGEVLARLAGSTAGGAMAGGGERIASIGGAHGSFPNHTGSAESSAGGGGGERNIVYESLGAFVEHPVYPTSRCRLGLSEADLAAYAPEFAPSFALRWARVPAERVTGAGALPGWWPGRPHGWDGPALFPVHPLTVSKVCEIPGVTVLREPHLVVRPTLSMRTVQVDARTHLKLPLPTSTLGARNRRSIAPGTLADGARAELLLREILRRERDLDVVLADEQTFAHAGHEYLGWMVRRLPPGEIVPVAALPAPCPGPVSGSRPREEPSDEPRVLDDVAARHAGGDVAALLAGYLRMLFTWNVRLFVIYGVALEAHQQNLALVFPGDAAGPGTRARLLVKDGDGTLVSPDRLRAAGLAVPGFADRRLLDDDPHALADVFVTITLHLAAAAIAFGAGHGELVAETLSEALAEHGGHPMARLLRARTLDAARLVGKSMVSAGTLARRGRIAADINKHYGTSGPNYLRRHHRRQAHP